MMQSTKLTAPKSAGAVATTTVMTRADLDAIRNLIAGGSTDAETQRKWKLARDGGGAAASAPPAALAAGNGERSLVPGAGGAGASSSSALSPSSAAARKARIMAIDEERRAKGNVSSLDEIEREAARQQDVAVARTKMHEEIDEVKHMNQVMLNAKCVTIRDAQVLDKRAIRAERAEEERRMDMMMELERLKALRMYEEREAKRVEDRRKGAAVIRAQMEEREQERLLRLELKQQEQEAMLRHIERMKGEDRLETERKRDAARSLMDDIALANAEQIRLKNRQRVMEVEEEKHIAAYVREKERREESYHEEQRRVVSEKEREIARLRSHQERAQDRQAEVDALRARRAQEAYDREQRQKDRDAKARQAAINADLAAAREMQMREKAALLAEQARAEKEEFDRIIAVQKDEEQRELGTRTREVSQSRANADALRRQITEVEENRRKARRDFLDEGNRQRAERREREALVDAIRMQKVVELEGMSVPKQYRQELLKKKAGADLRPTK
jgi:hypothetical protein